MPSAPAVVANQSLARPHLACYRANHEKRELSRSFGERVSRVREWNFVAVGVSAIDVVEAHGNLRYNFQLALAGFEHLSVNGITQRGDEAVNAAFHLLDNQLL